LVSLIGGGIILKLKTVTAGAASLAIALAATACTQPPPPLPYADAIQSGGNITFGADRRLVMLAGSRLGVALTAKLSADHPTDNIVLSPLELTKMLGMLVEGTEGPTQSEVRRALGEDAEHQIDTTAAATSLIWLPLRLSASPKNLFTWSSIDRS